MIMTWWMWFLLGLALMGVEMLTPGGFFIIFFGSGAIAVGVIDLIGIPLSLPLQVLVFVGVSVTCLLLFRKPMQRRFANSPSSNVDTLIGEMAQALEEIAPGATGKVELRGASWNARNAGTSAIRRSDQCPVERVDGLTLVVRC